MLFEFANVVLFLGFVTGVIFLILALGKFLRPNNPDPEKNSVYECGENPVGSGVTQFNMRFYLFAFLFVIFDVEIAFIFPVTALYKDLVLEGSGVLAFVEISIFVLILLVGLVYAWSQGCLEWVRTLPDEND